MNRRDVLTILNAYRELITQDDRATTDQKVYALDVLAGLTRDFRSTERLRLWLAPPIQRSGVRETSARRAEPAHKTTSALAGGAPDKVEAEASALLDEDAGEGARTVNRSHRAEPEGTGMLSKRGPCLREKRSQ